MLKKFEFCEILRKNALIRFYLVPWKDLLDLKPKTVVGLFFMQTILIFFSYTFSRTQVSNDLCHCDSFHQYCSLMSFYFLGCFKLTFSPLSFLKKTMKISVLLFGNGSLNFKCPGMGVRTCLFRHHFLFRNKLKYIFFIF